MVNHCSMRTSADCNRRLISEKNESICFTCKDGPIFSNLVCGNDKLSLSYIHLAMTGCVPCPGVFTMYSTGYKATFYKCYLHTHIMFDRCSSLLPILQSVWTIRFYGNKKIETEIMSLLWSHACCQTFQENTSPK